jgi:toxin-antitoxin system PIN domain toxin
MKLFLLDVNVLIALAWPNHPFHQRAVTRLTRRERHQWATCLLTQAAFVRLSSNPAVIPDAKSPSEAGDMLGSMVDDPNHVFLEAKTKRLEQLQELLQRCHGANQVNDAFLIWLAASHRACLLTFDSPLRHLASKPELVEVIT